MTTIDGKQEGGVRQVTVTEGIAGGEEKGGGEKTGRKSWLKRRNVTMAGQMTNDEQGLLKEKIVQLGQMDGGGLR